MTNIRLVIPRAHERAQLAQESKEWLGIVLAVALPLLAVVAHAWSSHQIFIR